MSIHLYLYVYYSKLYFCYLLGKRKKQGVLVSSIQKASPKIRYKNGKSLQYLVGRLRK